MGTVQNQATNTPAQSTRPVGQLNTRRSLLKFILLGIITFGIYPIVFYSGISSDINVIATRYDGRHTAHYCLICFVGAPITCGIIYFVWFHMLSARIGKELFRRGIDYKFGAATYWLWSVLGAFIIVGPFIYVHKLAKASNKLAVDFNERG